jgi:hypothetical protein
MGKKFGRVSIDKAKFNFLPENLREITWTESDEFHLVYRECYKIVFNSDPDSLHKCPELGAHVRAEALKLGCALKLFILTVMWGHRQAKPGVRFYCSMLSGTAAAHRVQRYRAEVENSYSTFTEKTLDDYASEELVGKTYESQLLDAEVQFGNWVVGYKIRKGGPVELPFFEIMEMQLPDLWLAVEPSYSEILRTLRSTKSGTLAQRRQRLRVTKLIGELKRRSKEAISVFKARENIMPKAIRRVVENRGFLVSNFQINPNQVWTSAPLFWTRLGFAIQHYWCLEYLHGDRAQASKYLGQVNS